LSPGNTPLGAGSWTSILELKRRSCGQDNKDWLVRASALSESTSLVLCFSPRRSYCIYEFVCDYLDCGG